MLGTLARLSPLLLGILMSTARPTAESAEHSTYPPNLNDCSAVENMYDRLLQLWTSGVRDYHSLLSAYLTANSIFVAVMGVLVSRESKSLLFPVLIAVLSVFGILMTAQMAIMLGRFSAQNALWAWKLRGIEQGPGWRHERPMTDLNHLREEGAALEDSTTEPATFEPNWALRTHRQWWAHRAISFPWFFGSVYALFFVWSLMQLAQVPR